MAHTAETGQAGAARDAESTRQRILEAATEAFAASGYDGASTRVIAGKAGVDPRLITRYYGSKEALFERVVERAYRHPLMMVPGQNTAVARALLDDAPVSQAQGLLLTIRSVANERAAGIMRRHLEQHYQRQLAGALPDGPDAVARAALLIAVCTGVQMHRNVLGNGALAGQATEAVVGRLAAALDLIGNP